MEVKTYQAARGNYWQNYIGEVGEWVNISKLKYLLFKILGYKVRIMENNYLTRDKILYLDMEWSDFLKSLPEQLGSNISQGNVIFDQKRKRHLVKMSIKYNVSMSVLNERYIK